jgi:hypothetical protein
MCRWSDERASPSVEIAIDVAAVADHDNDYDLPLIVDRLDDAVVPHSNAIQFLPLKLEASVGTRLLL